VSTDRASAAAPARRMSSDFWKFWAGQTISNLGSSFTRFALPLLVYKLTGSALNLGLTTAATMLPYLLFGLVIGAWVDRLNRKRLMIITDIARALVIGSIPLMAALGLLSVWWIYGVAFVLATLTIFFNSAQFAAIPSLVNQDDLVTANGRIQASYSGASVLGPFLASFLVAVLPLPQLMIFDAASFLVSSGSLVPVSTSFNAGGQPERKSIRRDVIEGLRYVLGHPVLRNISLMMALVNFVATTTNSQLVLFAQRQLHATNTQIGWLYSAASMGVVLALAAGPLRKRWSFSAVALGALMLDGLATVAFASMRSYWIALLIWALIGGLGILFNINTSSLRQAIAPNHMLGRVMSIASVLAWSAIPLGASLGGLAIQWTGDVALIYAAIGVLVFLIALAFSFTALGHADRYLPQKEPSAIEQAEALP
jgi:MFS family permease